MKKFKKYLLISIILFISLFISHMLISNVFISDSPLIRSNLGEYIAMKIKTKGIELASLNPFQSKNGRQLSNSEATKKVNEIEAQLANLPFQTVARGVQAKSNGEVSMRVIQTNEVDKVSYQFTLADGRQITISVLKELIDKYGWSEEDIKKMFSD